jgi:hypothetical protein
VNVVTGEVSDPSHVASLRLAGTPEVSDFWGRLKIVGFLLESL